MLNLKLIFITVFFLSAQAIASDGYNYAISTFGDFKYQKNFQNFDYINPNATKGGVVKYGAEGGFNNLNQFILKGISAAGLSYLYVLLLVLILIRLIIYQDLELSLWMKYNRLLI